MSHTNILHDKANRLGIDVSTLKERIVETWILQEKRKETVEDIRKLQAELVIIDEKLEERKDYTLEGEVKALLSPSKNTCEAIS